MLWVLVGLAFGLVFLFGRAAARMQRTAELAHLRFESESTETTSLAARGRELQEELAALGEARGLEEELRRKFRVAKEDEQLVVILDDETKKPTQPQRDERQPLFGWLWGIVRGVTSETYTRD